jgi:enoyl-CoA hydratase
MIEFSKHNHCFCGRRWYEHRLEEKAMALRESPASSGDGQVTLRIADAVAHVLFDRPWARNAMTWAMYDGLAAACAAINENSSVRVAVLRGAGGKAFVAGTDIAQFREFGSGDDGVTYEARLDRFVDTLERLRVPSIAVVEGFAVGAGLAIANACDVRIAASGARFGVPIARTLGNCLSAANLGRLCNTLGVSWVKRMWIADPIIDRNILVWSSPRGFKIAAREQASFWR